MAQYEFSDKSLPDNFDELARIVDEVRPIINDYMGFDLEVFLDAPTFAALSADDKMRVVQSIDAPEGVDRQWGLNQRMSEDGLFPYSIPTDFEKVSELDSYVISGACGSDVLIEAEDLGIELKTYNLDNLRLIGALAANSFNGFDGWEKTTVNGDTELLFGADFNGDFRMTHRKIRDKMSVTPNGDTVPFAPVKYEMIAAYHSVEEEIVDALLEHLASEMSDSERKRLFIEITDEADWGQRTKGINPFGDYGIGGGGGISFLPEWSEASFGRDGSIVCELRVSPSPRGRIQLAIASEVNGVRIMQRESVEDDETLRVISEVYIPDEDIIAVIRAVGLSDRGRTSPLEIQQLLTTRLLGKDTA